MTDQSRLSTAPAAPLLDQRRYNILAIVLHWTIAVLVLSQIGLGWYMNEVLPDHTAAQDQAQNIHVSLGLTILLLVLVRIATRLAAPPPPQRADTPAWERALINITHSLFYILLLVLPLTGWVLVSLETDPIALWGVIPWPHLPGLDAIAHSKPWRHGLKSIHTYWLVWLVFANLALHVAGALKHQFDGHPVLWRMWPGGKPKS
jgi:cytochrome b561